MYFLRRILQMIPVLLVVSFIGFMLLRAMPGNPFDSERKPATPEIERNLQAKFHLDESLWKQYLRYLGVVGDAYVNVSGVAPAETGRMQENDFFQTDSQPLSDAEKKEIIQLADQTYTDPAPVGTKRVFLIGKDSETLRTNAPVRTEDERVGYVEGRLKAKPNVAIVRLTQPDLVSAEVKASVKWAKSGLINGDLGPSLKYRNHTVNDIVKQCLPVSMTLGLLAFFFAMATGIPLGCYMALRRGEWGDYVGGFVAMLSFCIPSIVIAPLLILWLAVKLKILPIALWESPWHAILPTMVLGLYFSGRIARLMREGLSTTLNAEFITTARAKGVSESAILWKHAFRLAILPVLSYSGPLLADLLTGSFVVENIFQIPGLGVFFINSIFNKDYLMTVGLVLLYALLLLVINLLVDASYSLLDRRVRNE
ncbi:MAG: Binding-protein-dependent transport system inner rane component [Verrucomicrobiales bacterium]|nr:Binding-protein-dependent transport system inner rane component [Verrucomicrobiales bacterium]